MSLQDTENRDLAARFLVLSWINESLCCTMIALFSSRCNSQIW